MIFNTENKDKIKRNEPLIGNKNFQRYNKTDTFTLISLIFSNSNKGVKTPNK